MGRGAGAEETVVGGGAWTAATAEGRVVAITGGADAGVTTGFSIGGGVDSAADAITGGGGSFGATISGAAAGG